MDELDTGVIEYEDIQFGMVPKEAATDTSLSDGAYRLLSYLYVFRDRLNGQAWPGQKRLAADLNVSDRTIRARLKELEEAGWIQITQRGQGKTNLYKIYTKPKNPDRKNSSGLKRKETSGLDRKPASANHTSRTDQMNTYPTAPAVAYVELEYVPEGEEFEEDARGKQKWRDPGSHRWRHKDLVEQALSSCGRQQFSSREERSFWIELDKGMVSLRLNPETEYPSEWIENVIEWATRKNVLYQKQKGTRAVQITFPSLISAIQNKARRDDFVSQALRDSDDAGLATVEQTDPMASAGNPFADRLQGGD